MFKKLHHQNIDDTVKSRGVKTLTPAPMFCRFCFIILAIIGMVLMAQSSLQAHAIHIFAAVSGERIEGFAYFPGGGRYQNGQALVLDDTGHELATLTLDENGAFSFVPKVRTDHILVIQTIDGHRTEFTVPVDELPPSLRDMQAAPSLSAKGPGYPPSDSTIVVGDAEVLVHEPLLIERSIDDAELRDMLAHVVSQQLVPLRKQIDGYEQKIRIHDIVGGIGYIFGLMGLFYYLRRPKSDEG